MAEAGGNYNASMWVAETPETVSQVLISSVASVPNYTVNTAGIGSLVLTRKYTPTWAIVLAIVGAFVLLLGLLLLLIKETETLTVTLTPVEGGTKVAISGVASSLMLTRVSAALTSMKALDAETGKGDGAAAKDCPKCAETIKAAAKVCRFCGHKFENDA